jgi:hypothetical protein
VENSPETVEKNEGLRQGENAPAKLAELDVEELAAVLAVLTEFIPSVDSPCAELLLVKCRHVNPAVSVEDICAALRRELVKPGARYSNTVGWCLNRVPLAIRRELVAARKLAHEAQEWERRNGE